MAFGLDDPGKQRAALVGLVVLGLAYAFYQYAWKPVHEERVMAEQRLARVERYNNQARALTQPRRVNELKRQEAEYQVALAAYETMLPSEPEVAGLLSDVAGAAMQNEVKIVHFAPLQSVAGENLMEIPFDVQLQGGYHDIGRFLSEIANLPRLVRPSVTAMEQVRIQDEPRSGAPENKDLPPRYQVLATLRLSTFVPVEAPRMLQPTGSAPGPAGSMSSAFGPEKRDAI